MGITSTPTLVHWNYFLSVEEDLIRLSRFIEFHQSNYECFSIENTRILIAAAAETEVVCRLICKDINPASEAKKIKQLRDEITPQYPNFSKFSVHIPRYGLASTPWENWDDPSAAHEGVPYWWSAYNKMKHERDSKYHLASLKNVINAVKGLYVACLYLYKTEATTQNKGLIPGPKMLKPAEDRIDTPFLSWENWLYKL